MSTTDSGRKAELLVAESLRRQKHKIVSMNWRTKWCEIDIISKTKDCVYFTEVKYRSSDAWGDGFSYITQAKLKQMRFAAEMWISENNWVNDALLQAASVNSLDEIEITEIM
jgi:ribonuclease HII